MFAFGVFSRTLIKIQIECLPGSLFTPGIFLFQITCINDGLYIPLPQSSFPTSLFLDSRYVQNHLVLQYMNSSQGPIDASCLIKVTDVSAVQSLQCSYYPCSCLDCKCLSGLMSYLSTSPNILCISVYLLSI